MAFGSPSALMKPELFQGRGGAAFGATAATAARPNVMTVGGAVNATGIMLSLCVASAMGSWLLVKSFEGIGLIAALGGLVVALICGVVMWFKPTASPVAAPVYALGEGLVIGAISFMYAEMAAGTKVGGVTGTGIVTSASIATFAVLGVMLCLYKMGVIKATAKFRAVMLVVGGAVCLYCVVMMGLSLFGATPAALISGPMAIGVTAAILIYAAFLLILDFDMIEQGAAEGAPKYMEWYAGFGLLATLIMIYLQILRLLSLLNRRD